MDGSSHRQAGSLSDTVAQRFLLFQGVAVRHEQFLGKFVGFVAVTIAKLPSGEDNHSFVCATVRLSCLANGGQERA